MPATHEKHFHINLPSWSSSAVARESLVVETRSGRRCQLLKRRRSSTSLVVNARRRRVDVCCRRRGCDFPRKKLAS